MNCFLNYHLLILILVFSADAVLSEGQVVTIIEHDLEKIDVTATLPRSWRRTLQYQSPLAEMLKLINQSAFCYQEIIYECQGVDVVQSGRWMGGDGRWHATPGNPTANASEDNKCACGRLNACAKREDPCNCNTDRVPRNDRGKIFTGLPVRKIELGGVQGSDFWKVEVSPLKCSSRPIDLPRDCQEAKEKLGLKKNDVILIDIDGPDGDDIEPFSVHCDVESYHGVAVTQIPHSSNGMGNKAGENYVDANGDVVIDYTASVQNMRKLIDISSFCSQEIGYHCMNSALLGYKGSYWSSRNSTARKYWGGNGEHDDNKCLCGLTGMCDERSEVCNCNIFDGKTRQDFGLLTNKEHLPVESITMKTYGGIVSKAQYYVGWLSCASQQFGIEPSCQWYRASGHASSYSFLIDPDGPNGNVKPFPAHCEFQLDVILGVTMIPHTPLFRKDGKKVIYVNYLSASKAARKALTDRSVYCTQEIAWNCQNSPIHKLMGLGKNIVYWYNADEKQRDYFHGVKGDACACNATKSCTQPNKKCHCDFNYKETKDGIKPLVDRGILYNKTDLPVTKLQPQKRGYFELGPLKCYEVWPTCYDFKKSYTQVPGQRVVDLNQGRWVIDPDGPVRADPFTVLCSGDETVLPVVGNASVIKKSEVEDRPEAFAGPYKRCYSIDYGTSREQIQALTAASPFCSQFLNYMCQRAPWTNYAKWKTQEMKDMIGWSAEKPSMCPCGKANTCALNSTYKPNCNCDMNDGTTRWDKGYIIDKSILPVAEVCMGYDEKLTVRPRESDYELGKLVCSPNIKNIYRSCQHLRNVLGKKAKRGVHLIDPTMPEGPSSYSEDPFYAYCEIKSHTPVAETHLMVANSYCSDSDRGKWTNVKYSDVTTEQIYALKKLSTYCVQELSIQCNSEEKILKKDLPFWRYRNGEIYNFTASDLQCDYNGCDCDRIRKLLSEKTTRPYNAAKGLLPVSEVFRQSNGPCMKVGELKCFEVYRDCAEIRQKGKRRSTQLTDSYFIDPDGANGLEPFAVICDFESYPQYPITEVPHNTKKTLITNTNRKYTLYNMVERERAKALNAASQFCMQEVEYLCNGVALLEGGYAKLIATDGTILKKWVGADIMSNKDEGCACNALETCPGGLKCRCDSRQFGSESGVVTNKAVLPLRGFLYGGPLNEGDSGSIWLGSFKCAQGIVLPSSCKELGEEKKPPGEYVLNINGKATLVNCDKLTGILPVCESTPCQNGGECERTTLGFNCICPPGINGKYCEIVGAENGCSNNPCHTGGECTDTEEGYYCICKPGKEGENCENEVDECLDKPCLNDGTCTQSFNSFMCSCPPGYEGATCEINVLGCDQQPKPCGDRGECVELVPGYRCRCKTGFTGELCDTDIDECEARPCGKEGRCKNLEGSYECSCPPDNKIALDCYSACEKESPCKHGGACIDKDYGLYACNCSDTGYMGQNCTRKIGGITSDDDPPVGVMGSTGAQSVPSPSPSSGFGKVPSVYGLILIGMGVSDVFIMICVMIYFIKKRQREMADDLERNRRARIQYKKAKADEKESRKISKELKKGVGKEDAIRAFQSEREIAFTEKGETAYLPSEKSWPDEQPPDHEPTTAFAAQDSPANDSPAKDSRGTVNDPAHDSVHRMDEDNQDDNEDNQDDNQEANPFLSYTEDNHSPASTSYSETVNNELFASSKQQE